MSSSPNAPQQQFDAAVLQEAQRIKLRTEEARRIFNLVDSELVIEDYVCSIRRGIPLAGRMYISQNYVSFSSFIGGICEVLPYRKITSIVPQTFMVFNSGIDIDLEGNIKYQFANFNTRDQTLNLLKYLWKHPPSYVTLEPPAASIPGSSNNSGASSGGGSTFGSSNGGFGGPSYDSSPYSRDFDVDNRSGGYATQQKELVVDVETSRLALTAAQQTKEITQATMEELSRQAELLDRIEKDVENIHLNLDRGDRYIRSMEGVGGTIKNMFAKDIPRNTPFQKKDHSITLNRKPKTVDFSILIRNQDQTFTPAIVRFSDDAFYFLAEETQKPITGKEWSYNLVGGLVVNSRHLHMELRLLGPRVKNIVRIISSYLQGITNELALRTEEGQITVAFEPQSKSFQYGSFKVSDQLDLQIARAGLSGGNPHAKASDVLSSNVSQKVKDDYDRQNENLELLDAMVEEIGMMNEGIGRELVDQTERITKITSDVEQAQTHTIASTRRAKNLLT